MAQQTMQVRCSGPDYEPHAPVSFEFDIEKHPTLSNYAIQKACPFCALQQKIESLDRSLEEAWEKNRQTNNNVEMLMEMHEWWVKTCAVDDALKTGDDAAPDMEIPF